ncbi:MAG TPA: hypothetical protein VFT69_04950 [Pseudolabrys sp.]|jgi:hypothetical protein|nr:hypothetical protein [Pseudolabrys sp.]
MNRHFRTPLVAALAAGLTLSSFGFAAQAAPSQQPEVRDAMASVALSARKRHHHRHYRHHRGGERAALQAFGLIAGTIASIAAANAWRDRCGYYDCGYYDYGPRYYYRPYRHHRWRHWRGYSRHYNHYRPGVHIIP